MDIETLRLFVEVAHRGNFAAVARDHDIDPSSVSRAMATLEDELGVRLFQRTTRQIALTESGEIFLARIPTLLDEYERTCDETRGVSAAPGGTLRLTASVAFGNLVVLPLLPEFRRQYPGIKLELLFTDTVMDLITDRIDLALRLGPPSNADLVATKLVTTRYRVCASPEYLATHPHPATPADIQQHRCLMFAIPEFRARWRFRDSTGHVDEVPVYGDIAILGAMALRECALMGMGPVLLSDWLIGRDIREGRLIDLFPQHHVTSTDFDTAVWLIYPSRSHLPSKVRVMIDFLKSHVGA